jgi:hypothetical protein
LILPTALKSTSKKCIPWTSLLSNKTGKTHIRYITQDRASVHTCLPAHTRDRASHKKGRAKEEGGPKEITCLPAGRGQQQLGRQRRELAVDADLAVDELLQLQRMEEPRRRPGDAGDGDGGDPGHPPGCRRWTSSSSGMVGGAGAAAGDGGQAEQERQLRQRRGDVGWRSFGGPRSALTLARIPFYPVRTAADSHAPSRKKFPARSPRFRARGCFDSVCLRAAQPRFRAASTA